MWFAADNWGDNIFDRDDSMDCVLGNLFGIYFLASDCNRRLRNLYIPKYVLDKALQLLLTLHACFWVFILYGVRVLLEITVLHSISGFQ